MREAEAGHMVKHLRYPESEIMKNKMQVKESIFDVRSTIHE